MNIKNVFRTSFRRFFPLHFLLALYVCFWKNCFARFPPFFGHDIRVNIKKVFSHFFTTFFFKIFCTHYSCVSGKIFSRVLFPAFFGHDFRVNIKNHISHFFRTIFSNIYRSHYSYVSGKIV